MINFITCLARFTEHAVNITKDRNFAFSLCFLILMQCDMNCVAYTYIHYYFRPTIVIKSATGNSSCLFPVSQADEPIRFSDVGK